ncbi:MAG: hypothetical protein AABZ60_22850, partial [Planctomycetota bacterium]
MKRFILCLFFFGVLWAQNNEEPKKEEKPDNSKIILKIQQLQDSTSAVKSYKLVDELVETGEGTIVEILKVLEKPDLKIEAQRFLMETVSRIKTEKALETLKKAANAEDPWVRYYGISGLAALKKEQDLVSAGLASPHAIVKEAALRGLSLFEITWEKTPNSVLEVLETGEPQLVASACFLLKKIRYSGVPDFLVSCSKLLKKDNLPLAIRIEILQTVAYFPQEEVVNLLINTFDKEQFETAPVNDNEKYWIKLTILNAFQKLAVQASLTLLQKEPTLELLKKALLHEQPLFRAKAYSLIFTLFPQEKELLKKALEDSSPLVQAVGIQQISKWGEGEAKPLLVAMTQKSPDTENQNNLVQSLTLLGMKEEEVRKQLGQASVDGKWYSKNKADRLIRLEEEIKTTEVQIVEKSLPQTTFFTEQGKIVIELFEETSKDAVWHFLTCVQEGRFDNYLLDDINVSYLSLQLPAEFMMDYTVKGNVAKQPILKGALLMVADDDEDFGGRRFRLYVDDFANFQNKTFTFIGKVVEGFDILKGLSIGDRIKKAKITKLSRLVRDPLGNFYFADYLKLRSDYFRNQAERAYNNTRDDLKAERLWKKAIELQPDDIESLS